MRHRRNLVYDSVTKYSNTCLSYHEIFILKYKLLKDLYDASYTTDEEQCQSQKVLICHFCVDFIITVFDGCYLRGLNIINSVLHPLLC